AGVLKRCEPATDEPAPLIGAKLRSSSRKAGTQGSGLWPLDSRLRGNETGGFAPCSVIPSARQRRQALTHSLPGMFLRLGYGCILRDLCHLLAMVPRSPRPAERGIFCIGGSFHGQSSQ